MLIRLSLFASLLVGLGCNSVDSDNILTSGLYARVSATATGNGQTTVRTTLFLERPGSLDYIELEGDDVLIAYGPPNDSKIMRESQFLGTTSYSADFEAEDGETEFIVELSRTIDVSAPDSIVTLPAAFDVITADGSAYSRETDDVVIDWDPFDSGDDLDYDVSGLCINGFAGSVEGDPGTLTILAGDIVQAEGMNVDDSCIVTVTLTRSRPGTVDPNYGFGGDAHGYQQRTFTFTTDP